MPASTVEALNAGLPLKVVQVDGSLGIVDEYRQRLWMEYDLVSTVDYDPSVHAPVVIPPVGYGTWKQTSIGGISRTVRLEGILRAKPTTRGVSVFALYAPSAEVVAHALLRTCGDSICSVESSEYDEIYGHVTEVFVYSSDDVARVAACIARTGASPMLEDATLDALRPLGVERLDRIGAKVVATDVELQDGQFGVRRGCENWRFSWLPKHWKHPPITWDHLVSNMSDCRIDDLSQPLRQHVARERLTSTVLGQCWVVAEVPPTRDELEWSSTDPPPLPRRQIVRDAQWSERVAEWPDEVTGCIVQTPHCLLQGSDGLWYRPVDERARLAVHAPDRRRVVSAALEVEQSKQLITALFLCEVERVGTTDSLLEHACHLILYRYMVERGYTARWLGTYKQRALHIGNGDTFRRFNAFLSQYGTRERVPGPVLHRLVGRDGKLHTRGSKGSRSRHVHDPSRRYAPVRRLTRTVDDERRML